MIPLLQTKGKKLTWAFVALLGLGLLVSYCYQLAQARQAAADLLELQHHAQRLARLQLAQPSVESLSLPLTTVIEQSALRHQLTLISMEPEEDEINLTLAPMPFDRLIIWLAELQREHAIRVQTLKVTALPAPGTIHVDALRLQRLFSH
ncbi:type II secretion system protein GspM [Serratia sp. 2723]|uniref:type II secretion system protein GspM n=1 Tax=unclassified Serratia (in: enterobacteria) TaxID=2647522 RepID=UPI003D23391E